MKCKRTRETRNKRKTPAFLFLGRKLVCKRREDRNDYTEMKGRGEKRDKTVTGISDVGTDVAMRCRRLNRLMSLTLSFGLLAPASKYLGHCPLAGWALNQTLRSAVQCCRATHATRQPGWRRGSQEGVLAEHSLQRKENARDTRLSSRARCKQTGQ